MKVFNVKVMADRYPTDYRVEASDITTAAARGLRLWKKRFKRSKAVTVKVHITELGEAVND